MNTVNPFRPSRLMFVASAAMLVLSLAFSTFSVAKVMSAPLNAPVSVPATVGYEGFLADASGNPIADGTYSIKFSVYDVDSGGTALWNETQGTVQVTKGLYAVQLGSTTPLLPNLFNGSRWLGVTVGTGTEISPRTKVGSVPFALNAEQANSVPWTGITDMPVEFSTRAPLGVRVVRTITQTVSSGSDTTLLFDRKTDTSTHDGAQSDDTNNMWNAGAPDRLVCQTPGWYMAGGGVAIGFTQAPAGTRYGLNVRLYNSSGNLTSYLAAGGYPPLGGVINYLSVSTGMFYMHAGDYVSFGVGQSSGVSQVIGAATLDNQNYANGWLMRVQ